MDAAQ